MVDNTWRKKLENPINTGLSDLIFETKKYDSSIKKSSDKSKAQIWVALVILYNKINSIENLQGYKNKIPKKEMKKIIETLEKL